MALVDLEGKKSSHQYLHSLCIYPSGRFANQHQNEDVLVILRAHPITLLPMFGFALIISFMPIFVNIFLADFFNFFEILFINIVLYSGLFSFIYINLLLWAHTVGIITNHRIIDIDYTSILLKTATGSALDDIADVSGRTSGFFRTIFSFGDVNVQTAGIQQNIEFLGVPDPDTVVSLISRIVRDHRSSAPGKRHPDNDGE